MLVYLWRGGFEQRGDGAQYLTHVNFLLVQLAPSVFTEGVTGAGVSFATREGGRGPCEDVGTKRCEDSSGRRRKEAGRLEGGCEHGMPEAGGGGRRLCDVATGRSEGAWRDMASAFP